MDSTDLERLTEFASSQIEGFTRLHSEEGFYVDNDRTGYNPEPLIKGLDIIIIRGFQNSYIIDPGEKERIVNIGDRIKANSYHLGQPCHFTDTNNNFYVLPIQFFKIEH